MKPLQMSEYFEFSFRMNMLFVESVKIIFAQTII